MYNDFKVWLASEDVGPYMIKGEFEGYYAIMRVCKNEDIDFLFVQCNYRDIGISSREEFRYGGTYCRKDNLLYCVTFDSRLVKALDIEDTTERSIKVLSERKRRAVCKRVREIIEGDRKNLFVSELTNTILISNLDYIQSYGAYNEARRRYLSDEGDVPPFECEYHAVAPEETVDLLPYILNPVGTVEAEAALYLRDHQEELLFSFLRNDAVSKEYQAILSSAEDPVHTVKKIMGAMKTSPAKTVNVTIFKDGVEFTFKTDAGWFRRDCQRTYSTWDITAPDRRKFEEIFGRNSDYGPMDILRITYGRKTLYEAD